MLEKRIKTNYCEYGLYIKGGYIVVNIPNSKLHMYLDSLLWENGGDRRS